LTTIKALTAIKRPGIVDEMEKRGTLYPLTAENALSRERKRKRKNADFRLQAHNIQLHLADILKTISNTSKMNPWTPLL
jgi:hypothetical protein